MKVRYRANDTIADLSDEAARVLVDAGICDLVESGEPPPKARKRA